MITVHYLDNLNEFVPGVVSRGQFIVHSTSVLSSGWQQLQPLGQIIVLIATGFHLIIKQILKFDAGFH